MPSACEGFGHSLRESAARGRVVLFTNSPPTNEWLDDGTSGIGLKYDKVVSAPDLAAAADGPLTAGGPPTADRPSAVEGDADGPRRGVAPPRRGTKAATLAREVAHAGGGCFVVSPEEVARGVRRLLLMPTQAVEAIKRASPYPPPAQIPSLSMHSIRETVGVTDIDTSLRLFRSALALTLTLTLTLKVSPNPEG